MNKRSLSQRTRPSFGSNKYRGVHWYPRTEKWQVCIKINGKNKYFGYFFDEEDGRERANKAYAEYFPGHPELQQRPRKEAVLEINNIICKKWR